MKMRNRIGNRKGNVHIDWVVSIALFLTFIIILLGFIKPSYKPAFEGDVLIDMVLEEFNERVEWEVYKTMLSFDECEGGSVVNIDLENYIPNYGNFKVINKDKNDLGQEISPKYKGSLTIDTAHTKKFWVIHNDNIMGYGEGVDPGDATGNCAKVGAANPIVFRGIKESELTKNKLKMEDWNFPDFRYFRIQVRESDGSVMECFAKTETEFVTGCENMKLPDEVPVYSANMGTVILDKDLGMEQVIVNVEVW